MTVYQWVFFNREEQYFSHIESTSKEEADRKAWDLFKSYIDQDKVANDHYYATAYSFEEFVMDRMTNAGDDHYTRCYDHAGLSAKYIEITF